MHDWNELQVWFVAYQDDGDDVVRELFEALRQRISMALSRKGCKPEDVADLTQTILLKIHTSRDRYRPDLPLRAWITTIVERTLIDFWRKTRRQTLSSIDGLELPASITIAAIAGTTGLLSQAVFCPYLDWHHILVAHLGDAVLASAVSIAANWWITSKWTNSARQSATLRPS